MDASPMSRNFYQHHNIHKRSPSPTIRLPNLIDPRKVKLIKTAAIAGTIGAGAGLVAASAVPAGTFALGTLSIGR